MTRTFFSTRSLLEALQVAFTFLVLGILVFPFLWVFLNSIRPSADIISDDFYLLPKIATFENYVELADSDFPDYIKNSLLVSIPSTFLSVVISLLAAYSFSRRRFRGRYVLLILIVFSQLFPFIILTTPVYLIFFRLGLVNSHWGLIITYTAISIPFSVYMLLGYLDSVPRELDEAAIIDGSTTLGIIFRVIVPVAWPGIAATAIYSFVRSWNDYIFAVTLNTNNDLRTIPVGLANFFGQYTTDWGLVMTASVLATLPTFIIFFFLQRQLISGLAAGAVKT
jgi:multiple sugar transport system permease protein